MSKLLLKYENWLKQKKQNRVYRYMSNMYRYMLAKNDQNTRCTGTCSRCTGTCHPKMPRLCVFVPFFHIFLPKSTLYIKYTSKPLQIQLMISFLLNLSFNTYPSSKHFMIFSQNNSNMGYNPYTYQIQEFVRVYSNPNSFTLQLNHESNLKVRIIYFSYAI